MNFGQDSKILVSVIDAHFPVPTEGDTETGAGRETIAVVINPPA